MPSVGKVVLTLFFVTITEISYNFSHLICLSKRNSNTHEKISPLIQFNTLFAFSGRQCIWSKCMVYPSHAAGTMDLGANWLQTLWRVLVPLLAPGIAAGALLAFTLSIDDFVISFFVAGPGSTTLPIRIYSMIKFGATPLINALSALLLLATFILVWASQHLTRDQHA